MNIDDPNSTLLGDGSQRGDVSSKESPWDLIAERIDQFASAWEDAIARNSPPPDLRAFALNLGETVAYTVMVELAKFDMERRWQTGREPHLAEWYAREIPLLGPVENLPVDLIYEELQARMQRGEQVSSDELHQRFPQQAGQLIELLGGMAVSGSPTCTYFADTVQTDVQPREAFETPSSRFRAGERIDDFELLAPLGKGAFATVFLARQLSMERLVALKISKQVGSEPQTLAQLDHPNIVRVYDLRNVERPPVRLLYMEVVSGGTLLDAVTALRLSGDRVQDGKRYLAAVDEKLQAVGAERPSGSATRRWLAAASWPQVVCYLGAKLAEGLHYAHRRGVLHRDIKPANVLLTSEGAPKLADFNVSFNGGRADENPEDAFGGSLAYMSPEQLEACHPLLAGSPQFVREQSDIYALGVMLWELLSGRRPFDEAQVPSGGGTLVRLQRMIEQRRNCDLAATTEQLPDECPDSLRQVLLKCLQPAKGDRYGTAAELGRALDMCLHPRCWRLLQEPLSWAGKRVLAHPVASMVLAGLIPNLLFAAFNFQYNKLRIFARQDHELIDRFWTVQAWINGIAFPLGIVVGARAAYGVLRLLKGGEVADARRGIRRVFVFGAFISVLLLSIWFVSGLAFPIAMFAGRPDQQSVGFFGHFFLSLALCGFGAAAYPYFLITLLAVRYFVPALIRNGVAFGPQRDDLIAAARYNRVHLLLSGLVPMLGAYLILNFGDHIDWAPQMVTGAGIVGFVATFLLERSIDADLKALEHIVDDDEDA